MKIWIVKKSTNLTHTFLNQKDYDSWLLRCKEQLDSSVVTIYEATQIETNTVKEIKESIKEANIRESRIQAVISDDTWFSKFETLKGELIKYEAVSILDKLNMIGNDKKIVTKYLKSQKELLLCDVSEDVKWFELIIDFLEIKEMVDGSYKKINGWNTKVMVSKKRKDNFLKAQRNVQKSM